MGHELYRHEGDSFRSVTVNVDKDKLSVHTQDMGPITEAAWGDSDYEFWTSVKREHWDELIVALIREVLAGNAHATSGFEDICSKHDVPYESGRWA